MVPWVTTPENGATLGPLEDLLDVLDLKPVGSAHITISAAAGALSMESDIGESEAEVFIGRSQPMPHGLLDVLDLKPVGSAHITISAAAGALSMESDIGESEAEVFIGRSQPMPHG